MQTVFKSIRAWFISPVFNDSEDKTRNAQVLYAILGNLIAVMVLAILAMIFVSVQKIGIGILLFILFILILISRTLVQRGHVLIASRFFVSVAWALFALLYVFGGRTVSSATSLLMAITVTAGVLLGKRSTIILAALSSLIGLGMAIHETAGYPLIHIFPGPPIPSWATWTLAFLLTLTPLNLTIQSIVRSTEALRERNHFIESLLTATPDVIHVYSIQDRRTVFSSRSVRATLGYTSEESQAMGSTYLQQLLHPEDYARLPKLYGRWETAEDGKILTTEYRMRNKSGKWRWFLGRDMVFKRGMDGKVQQFIGTVQDITDRRRAEEALQQSTYELGERVKELNCLYSLSSLIEASGESIKTLMQGTVELLPPAWQYPSITCARIILDEQTFTTPDFQKTPWMQQRPILIRGAQAGRVEVCYFEDKSKGDEDIFLLQEERLLDVIAERLGKAVEGICDRQALRESEHNLKESQRIAKMGRWQLDLTTNFLHWSDEIFEIFEIDRERFDPSYDAFLDAIHPEDREVVDTAYKNSLKNKTPYNMEHRLLMKDGRIKWVNEICRNEFDSNGKPLVSIGVVQDITERKQVEEQEREQRDLAEALSDSAAALNSTLDFNDVLDRIMDNVGRVVPHDAVGIILLDEIGQTAKIVGYRDMRKQPVDREGTQFLIPETRNLRELQATGEPVIIADTRAYDGWVETPAGDWIRTNLGVPIKTKEKIIGFLTLASARANSFIQLDAERLQAFVSHAAIAIENARLYEDVQKLAVTDALTGLFNHSYFNAEMMRLESSRDYPVSIVIADMDDLKRTNDTFGHLKGDETLKHVASILLSVFRAADIIARIGGDEFSVLLPRTDSVTVEKMLSRIQKELANYNAEYPDLPIKLSLGASTAENNNLAEAFAIADQRMYENKAMHKAKKDR